MCFSGGRSQGNRAAAPSSDQHRGAAATCQTERGAPVRLQARVRPKPGTGGRVARLPEGQEDGLPVPDEDRDIGRVVPEERFDHHR